MGDADHRRARAFEQLCARALPFADPADSAALLAAAGWTATVERVDFDYVVGAGHDPVADAVAFLSRIGPAASALRDTDPDGCQRLLVRLRERLNDQRLGDAVTFPAAAWLWTARA